MRKLVVSVAQFASGPSNMDTAEGLVREAAKGGANIVLLQELFETLYFCQTEDGTQFANATTLEDNQAVKRFKSVAQELGIVIPVSFFERRNNAFFNAIAIIDADGKNLGVYRKSHIPDGAGYREKYYFSPGRTGFEVWDTAFCRLGCGVCWDQWYPEAPRIFALKGAEVLLYPTAIGSEPKNPTLDSLKHWRAVMQGHAAANMIPLAASNRIGVERASDGSSQISFYGSSFIADIHGQVAAELGRHETGVALASFDLDELRHERACWGLFRDRRPDLYEEILSLDG
ncbi:MAG: N-carbamoylputrescine amidase [Clostridiales bacterium]|jgi:N-carbamoylputrescine amidase|nr:N-carbamoylputrescine amidase [Clostridiales bacterium]